MGRPAWPGALFSVGGWRRPRLPPQIDGGCAARLGLEHSVGGWRRPRLPPQIDGGAADTPCVLSRFIVCPVHVGRAREVDALRELAAAVGEGAGRTLLISGEVGVGKTRMAQEAQRVAREAGFTVLEAGCEEGASTAYAPLAAAVRRHTRRLAPDELRELLGGPARLVAALLPELAAEIGAGSIAGSLGTEDLDAAAWHLLARLAAAHPVLLLVEDLHWASTDMLRLLTSLIRETRELPVLVVGTYRPDEITRHHPLAEALTQLSRLRGFEEMRLAPLDQAALRGMLSAIFDGTEVGEEFVTALLERTGGNPFFVEELCRVLVDRGDVVREGGGWTRRDLADIELPFTVREAVLARTRRLPAAVVQALELAAIAGELVEPDVLRLAAGVDAAGVREVLTAAIDAQLLTEQRDGRRRVYRFRHNLTREFLAAERVGPDRQEAHRRVAEALTAVYAGDLDPVAPLLADHFEEAGELDRAAAMAAAAARHAVRERAPREAIERYTQALRLLPRGDAARLELLVEAAEATVDADDRRAATAFAGEAERLAASTGDCVAEVRALRVEAQARWWSGDVDGALQLGSRLIGLVEGRGDRWELAAISYLARRHALLDHEAEATSLVERGLAMAAELDEPVEESRLWETRAVLGAGNVEEAGSRALAAARRAGDPHQEVMVLCNTGGVAAWHGRFEAARSSFEAAIALTAQLVTPMESHARVCLGEVLAVMGRLDEASDLLRRNLRPGDLPNRLTALPALGEVAWRRGDEAALRAHASEGWELARDAESQTLIPALTIRARAALLDALEAARPMWAEAMTRARQARGARLLLWWFAPDAARALAAAGEGDALGELATEVRTLVEDGAAHDHNLAAVRLCEGLALGAAADTAAAVTALQDAASRYAALPAPARHAEALLALAEVTWGAGDVAASIAAGQSAAEVAATLGSGPLADEAAAALRRAGVRASARRTHRGADELSAREREVAALVARGLTNAEIGRRLFLSELTARNYVSSILGKLELRSRAEVARFAAESGLLEDTPPGRP